jgi:peptidoglycan-associated lipoprotein
MKRAHFIAFAITVLSSCASFGCADKPPVAPATVTSAPRPYISSASPHVGLSEDIAIACNIKFDTKDAAPKFDFDQSDLLPADRDILQRVAVCVTTGPLRGRALRLVGHADPRGETEYNMTLGALRAGSASSFLTHLGVDPRKLAQSSRGELDATGSTEDGWRHDRRVDILLQQ